MARLYADENFPHPVVEELRRAGHDVLTAAEAGQAGRRVPDEAVVAFAHSQARAILTHNRKHFRHLHESGSAHSGLIPCTVDPDFRALAARIDEALDRETEPTGRMIRINRPLA